MDSTTPEQTVPHQNRLTTSMSPTVTASLSNTSSPLTINRHSDTSLLLPSFATTSDTTTVAATGLSLLPTAAAVRTAAAVGRRLSPVAATVVVSEVVAKEGKSRDVSECLLMVRGDEVFDNDAVTVGDMDVVSLFWWGTVCSGVVLSMMNSNKANSRNIRTTQFIRTTRRRKR
eukprot:GHVS01012384.1.p2 GENE.GHVS01012384.1~~GHVS01012384.1.p2  ORF type:complete len:173 (-),score=40.66 GHVS01012384.1:168-686(-)